MRRCGLAVTLIVMAGACKQAREWGEKREKRAAASRQEAAEAAAVHATEPPPVRARPTGPGLAPGAYRLVDVRVEALPTNRKGRPWDDPPGEEPDLLITLRVDGEERASCKAADNSLHGRCKLDVVIQIDASTQIALEVEDRDRLLPDKIGTATLTDPSVWGTGMDLPLMPAERLRAATIVFAREPTWWDLHRARLLGLGAGVLGALAIVGMFRRPLMPPPVAPPSCSHCGAVLGASLAKCTHCGAVQKVEGA